MKVFSKLTLFAFVLTGFSGMANASDLCEPDQTLIYDCEAQFLRGDNLNMANEYSQISICRNKLSNEKQMVILNSSGETFSILTVEKTKNRRQSFVSVVGSEEWKMDFVLTIENKNSPSKLRVSQGRSGASASYKCNYPAPIEFGF
jgi:hypothetical protein